MRRAGHQLTAGTGEAPLASVPFALKTLQFAAVELAERKVFRHFANPLVFQPLPDSRESNEFSATGLRHKSS